MDLVLFGAQGIALGAHKAVCRLYPEVKIRCFLVSQMNRNPSFLGGLPVREVEEFAEELSQKEKDNTEVLIAVPENVMPEIENTLEMHGFHCHMRLTSLRWAELMGCYYMRTGEYVPLPALPAGFHMPKAEMYITKFYKDKPLKSAYTPPAWAVPIQAGATLCSERTADILDCEGENISEKNGNYSELTALYWIWKNRLQQKTAEGGREYYGLSHYRRVLELSEDDLRKMADNGVDAVLPYPMPYEPDIEAHHKRYLADADWQALCTALAELQPEYAEAFPRILKQQYFYNYNIILAERSVLDGYCSWLFPILERAEQLSIPKGWERQDRYIGYMGETLETLYFMHNSGRLNIAHAGCRFLV